MKRADYDLIVIGSGDAGSEAALMTARAGKKVALVEADKWGGSGLNYTNIPQGAVFHASQLYKRAVEGAKFGLSSGNLRFNYPTINNWKKIALKRAGANSKKAYEEAGVDCIHGRARFLSNKEIAVGDKTMRAKNFLIATGASIADTGIKIADNVDYILPEGVTDLLRLPRSIFVVGGGATGCEIAQYFASLGVETVIADIAGRLMPREDEEVGQVIDGIFNKQEIRVLTQSRVVAIEKDGTAKKVIFMRGGQEKSIRVDEVVICTGSAPNVDIGLENTNVKFDRTGIKVNGHMQTKVKHIFAAGDVVGGHSSTEKALIEARIAVAYIMGRKKATADYTGIIRMTNLDPEIACVGITEDDCIKSDRKFVKLALSLNEVPKANISDSHNGFIKLVCDKRDKKLLGATLLMPHAGLVAQELAMAMRYEMTLEEICNTPHVANDWGELVRVACEKLCYD